MVTSLMATVILFVVALIISTIIIYVASKIFGQREGIDTALPTALIGTIVYALAYYFLGSGLVAAVLSGFVWLLVLSAMYEMSFLRAIGVAILVWIGAAVVGIYVPTLIGPL